MAGLTKEQRAAKAANELAAESQSDLVSMHKDSETIEVHPTCVKAHLDAGWKVTE